MESRTGARQPAGRSPYVSRHTTATLLSQANVPEEIRMQIMGQSSAVAHRGYAHIDQTETRKALANLDQRSQRLDENVYLGGAFYRPVELLAWDVASGEYLHMTWSTVGQLDFVQVVVVIGHCTDGQNAAIDSHFLVEYQLTQVIPV